MLLSTLILTVRKVIFNNFIYSTQIDFLYFYIQSEIKGDNTLSIYNKKDQLLDEYSLEYDIIRYKCIEICDR